MSIVVGKHTISYNSNQPLDDNHVINRHQSTFIGCFQPRDKKALRETKNKNLFSEFEMKKD